MWYPLSMDDTFLLDKFVILCWLLLIIKPRDRFTQYFIIVPTIIFMAKSVFTFYELLFERTTNILSLNFFSFNLFNAYKETLFIVRSMAHFHVTELWLGLWMVRDFNTRFTCAYYVQLDADGNMLCYNKWTEERVVFTAILIVTYFLSPIGCIIYFLATKTYFDRFTPRELINWTKPQGVKLKKSVSDIDYQFFSTRAVRFGDSLSDNLRKFYRFFRGLIGATIGLMALGFYGGYVVYCLIIYRTKKSTVEQHSRWPPACVRTHMVDSSWQSITTPVENRDWRWKVKSYWFQLCTFLAFGPNGEKPLALFRAMQNDFSTSLDKSDAAGFFPFGDGVGVGAHKYVKAYLESRDPLIIKDYQTIGWSVSSSLIKYCSSTHIFLPNPSQPTSDHHLLSRKIIHRWLAAFPHRLASISDPLSKNAATYEHLSRIVPRQLINEPSKDVVYLAVGETIFFLATGGFLTREEREAYLDCVKNPFTFLPDWLNFFVAGNYMENKGYSSYEKFQAAFARHVDGPALKAAFEAAEGKLSKFEVLRLVTSTFCLGAAPGPAKLTESVIHRLWSDQSDDMSVDLDGNRKEKMIDLFHENPRNFIKECARLNSVLPMVSLLSNDNIVQDVKNHTGADIPANTRIHCSLMDANNDPNEFTSPNEFNPRRPSIEMAKIMTWNGSEGEIEKNSEELRPPRYCPGHNLSLQVIEYLATRFSPVFIPRSEKLLNRKQSFDINDTSLEYEMELLRFSGSGDAEVVVAFRELYSRNHLDAKTDKYYLSSLDGYTKLIMTLSKLALKGWNTKPPRAIDINEPSNLPTQALHLRRVDGARFVGTWDEDDRSVWHFHQKLVNKILNSSLWPLEDLELPFNSVNDMISWRYNHFPSMPPPNNPLWCGDSDKLMSHFAFFGLACHHTRKLSNNEEYMKSHMRTLPNAILKSARYVNDMTALSLFTVRPPFERYGAAAYFDHERHLIGIYLSHRDEFIMRSISPSGNDNIWAYAKYMWRSSALALITIQDHLLVTHFIEANTLTNVSRQYLPASHPLRIFLKPFTYRTVTINHSAATSLVNERGLCHRIWGFEHDEFLKVCDYVIAQYRFRIMPDWIDDSMKIEQNLSNETHSDWVNHFPIAEDLSAYWKITRDYVRRFFEIEYGKEESTNAYQKTLDCAFMSEPCERRFIVELCKPLGLRGIPNRDSLIDVIAQLICACTGIHEHVGHVGDYLYDPRFIGTKLRRDLPSFLPSVQNYSLMLVLTVLTAMKMPGLMDDWAHLIPRSSTDSHEKNPSSIKTEADVKSHLDNYYLFKQQLIERVDKIDQRHQNSNSFPFQSFNPRQMECSVSV